MAAQLRVYPSSKMKERHNLPAARVGIRLGDLLPLVAVAHRQNYLWLQDFLDDEVRITSDLYDVLRAFRAYKPSA
jgi:hypothetical protein